MRLSKFRTILLAGCAGLALSPAFALAQTPQARTSYNIPAQDLGTALTAFGQQSEREIVFSADLTRNRRARAITGDMTTGEALAMLLADSGLGYRITPAGSIIVEADAPQGGSAAGDGAGTVEALIVTAQKKEENVQDVPIAISAFTAKSLEEQKIEGGFDLLKAIPNVTFSKNNFTSYNFSIRGIGTKAVSATTDPAVAVSFNNIALLQNRLFEQEYFDVERVEVLRGPQGTLYGRNATAGVINLISAKPNLHEFDGWLKGEVGNYHAKRGSAMVNIPLIDDKLAVRLAGSFTDRAGYDFNSGTAHAVNGRDLWSARVTVGFNPTESVHTNLVWERFNEDDNRSRTGKQLCHYDPGLTSVNGAPTAWTEGSYFPYLNPLRVATFSQGCKPGSLYDDAAFGTPNGLALPFVYGVLAMQNGLFHLNQVEPYGLLIIRDPYSQPSSDAAECEAMGATAPCYVPGRQSKDLRVIDSFRDPVYQAKADVVEFNLDWDVSDALTLSWQTAYNKDQTYSFQDFNRFNSLPIFNDTSGFDLFGSKAYSTLAPGGIFNDPQLGPSNKLAGFDIAQAKGEQFTSEIRLQSDFDGPINFSAGANYTRFRTTVDYYVFYNLITAFSMTMPFNGPNLWPDAQANIYTCYLSASSLLEPVNVPIGSSGSACPYIDPNPIESINGEGHNYFRSKNPYKLKSGAAFGELYWQVQPDLKITAGLRYTDDRKTFTPVPSQILLAPGPLAGGDVARGYPEEAPIKQHWGEWTGRLGVDWKPTLSFTDDTLLYAFYSHGYKAGGANPPEPGFTEFGYNYLLSTFIGAPYVPGSPFGPRFDRPILELTGKDYGPTFKPEYVDAFELGSKNTLLDGALRLNTTAFFYDYKDYQVSQIKNRTAVNENFDAQVWGLEFETLFSPTRNFQIVANLGYLDTKIADGASSINLMDRTQGNDQLVVAKPWVQIPSNCVVPVWVVQEWLTRPANYPDGNLGGASALCGGTNGALDLFGNSTITDTRTGEVYDPRYYDGVNDPLNINGGAGIREQLGGNELPNAPHWTMNVGAQYGMDILADWRATVRADAYWQSQSWARVYNDNPYDKLHGWYNVNLSVWIEKPDDGLKIEFYAKNLLDKTPITDAFLNSDDTALTTNVFVLDPRLIGLSIKKAF